MVAELKAAGYGCAWVHKGNCRGGLTGDHIVPLSKGGGRGRENVQLLCLRHNSSKQAR